MHEKKTEEGNIKNMSIFHDWTSHKKPCDHHWSFLWWQKKACLKTINGSICYTFKIMNLMTLFLSKLSKKIMKKR